MASTSPNRAAMTAPRIPAEYFITLGDWTARPDLGGNGYECHFYPTREALLEDLTEQQDDGRTVQVIRVAGQTLEDVTIGVRLALRLAEADHPLAGAEWDYRDRDRERAARQQALLRRLQEPAA